jgi:hypothetical protein
LYLGCYAWANDKNYIYETRIKIKNENRIIPEKGRRKNMIYFWKILVNIALFEVRGKRR